MKEEIFGLVVVFCKVKDFDYVFVIVNNMEYGLIGVVIINNCDYIEKVCEDFYVGNLYFNCGCIGVIVGY